MIMAMMTMIIILNMAQRLIPTMTNSHHGGDLTAFSSILFYKKGFHQSVNLQNAVPCISLEKERKKKSRYI